MRAEELWKAYCEKENIGIDTPYGVCLVLAIIIFG